MGALWENFVISERIKKNSYEKNGYESFFWRLHTGAEIDYIEQQEGGRLLGVEIKSKEKNVRVPKSFIENYPDSQFRVVFPENSIDFLL
jgi:predicted AAA+ superfamily ATPase